MADARTAPGAGVDHEAFFYRGQDEFVRTTVDYARAGLALGDQVCVAVIPEKIGWLRRALGPDAELVTFVDMAELGRNPARIIATWQKVLHDTRQAGRRLRGVGEPIWPGRPEAEVAEGHLHESLINLAFRTGPRWLLRCPYDLKALPGPVATQALRGHPVVGDAACRGACDTYAAEEPVRLFGRPLPEPAASTTTVDIRDENDLPIVHTIVMHHAQAARLSAERASEFALAVYEASTNSLRHGTRPVRMRVWPETGAFVCEIRDRGRIGQPLVGRLRPELTPGTGRGLWLVNQLCDLVQLRSGADGTVIRLQMAAGPRGSGPPSP